MNTWIKIWTLLTALLLLTACNEDDPFAGTDNYITSFSLKQGDKVLNAEIAGNVITLRAPEGFSLNGATPTVRLSENARMYPDPALVGEWDDEILFAITAHNGTQLRYKYTVVRTSMDAAGTVVLETQADVDAFGQRGITAIEGNLVIGRTLGLDSITSLAPLAQLKEIGYSLIIYPTYSAADLTGLDKLEKVGGDIRMDGVPNLTTATLPNLKTANEIYIKNTLVGTVGFPALKTIVNTLTLDCPLAEMRFPNLTKVGGAITLNTVGNSGAILPRFTFSALEEAGNLYFAYFKNATKVELPELKRVGGMSFLQCTMLSVIIAPKLEVATGIIAVPYTLYMPEVSFPSLTQVASLTIDSKTIRVLDFPKLKTVTDRLSIQSAQVSSLADFKVLEDVKGELYLYELSQMTSLALPASLKHIGTLVIDRRNAPIFAEINIKGMNIGELRVRANAIKSKIVGDDVFRGTLTIDSDQASYNNGYPGFPVLEGFHELDSLSFGSYVSAMDTVHVRGVRKINKGFFLPNSNIRRFSMPDLEEVGGRFFFSQLNQGVDGVLEFPKLSKVAGNFEMTVGSGATHTLKFTALKSVGGNFTVYTGNAATYSWDVDRDLTTILFPALETIGGKLKLTPSNYGTSYFNNKLTNFDGFAKLRSVQSMEIANHKGALSFQGFKEAFKSVNAAGWVVSGNGYNPTYADVQNGKWIKP